MDHVLWVGGPPGVGKTTVAHRLARRHGLRLYSADTRTWEHRDRALRAGSAAARRWEALAPADRWEGPTADLLALSLHLERGPMVVDDLRALPTSPLVVAEGSVLPAAAVASGVADRRSAVWLVPTGGFHEAQLAARGTVGGPLRLHRALRRVIAGEAGDHGVPTLTVDGAGGPEVVVAAVECLFGDALRAGPRAGSLPERRRLLREANEAIVGQVRGYYARPWAVGDPDRVTRSFACECGRATCDAEVVRSVGDAATGPVLADGHNGA